MMPRPAPAETSAAAVWTSAGSKIGFSVMPVPSSAASMLWRTPVSGDSTMISSSMI